MAVKDGMDIALCALNTETNVLQFAGANNPLYIIRNVETIHESSLQHELIEIKPDLSTETRTLFEVKADKMPISIHVKMESFTNHEIQLKKGDTLYLFSDGYADQFGGSSRKLPIAISDFLRIIHITKILFKSKIYFKIIKPWYFWINTFRFKYFR